MNRSVVIAYVVAVHAALAVVALKPNFASAVQARLGFADMARVRFAQDALTLRLDPVVPSGSTVFHGDSITQALPTSVISARAVNFGVGSQTTLQLATMMTKLNSHKTAERVFLNIGTNDIGPGQRGHSAEDLAAVLDLIPAAVPVVWSSIMPRAGHEAAILAANKTIASLCAARPSCSYLDTHATMAPAGDGVPLADIYIDGVHPNVKGYGLWIAALKSAI
ncbi:SGNH/GDSL hydrolase family protein [Variovorax sp. W2I14]|uniref:SGNH/GDSL hydrolase family protein n=1 Tax=Variovorax sp. W2I14 TaxID=3042290 RepID=UPI003D20C637